MPFYRASVMPQKRGYGRGAPVGYRRGRKNGGFSPILRDLVAEYGRFGGKRCEKVVY
jgi:hypothetical protein